MKPLPRPSLLVKTESGPPKVPLPQPPPVVTESTPEPEPASEATTPSPIQIEVPVTLGSLKSECSLRDIELTACRAVPRQFSTVLQSECLAKVRAVENVIYALPSPLMAKIMLRFGQNSKGHYLRIDEIRTMGHVICHSSFSHRVTRKYGIDSEGKLSPQAVAILDQIVQIASDPVKTLEVNTLNFAGGSLLKSIEQPGYLRKYVGSDGSIIGSRHRWFESAKAIGSGLGITSSTLIGILILLLA